MAETRIFRENERPELIDDELVNTAPIGSRRAYMVDVLNRVFVNHASRNRLVRVQNPIQLGEFGEPEADIAVVSNRTYIEQHPQATTVLLIIEVAETSLDYEQTTKLPYYARHGIPEVWIIDLDGKRVGVYRTPIIDKKTYRDV